MGILARVRDFTRVAIRGVPQNDTKADMGGGEIITGLHFSAPGDDANPLDDDRLVLIPLVQTGRYAAVAYHDIINGGKADRGERRIYSRNAEGEVVAEVWLKKDGTIVVSNDKVSTTLQPDGTAQTVNENSTVTQAANGGITSQNNNGSYALQAGGNFVVNGVTIDTNGNISTAGIVEADDVTATGEDVTLSSHNHGGPPPTPGT